MRRQQQQDAPSFNLYKQRIIVTHICIDERIIWLGEPQLNHSVPKKVG